jgi:hypothetical protein
MKPKGNRREPFVMIPVEVLEKLIELPTVATFRAWLMLERENARHRGKRNGSLILTYTQMREAGIGNRNVISAAIRHLEAAGIAEAKRGVWRPGVGKRPTLYPLAHHKPPDAPAADDGKTRVRKQVPGRVRKQVPMENSLGYGNRYPKPGTETGTTSTHLQRVQGEAGATVAGETAEPAQRRHHRKSRLGSSPLRNGAANGAAATATAIAKLAWHAPVVGELPPDDAADVLARAKSEAMGRA